MAAAFQGASDRTISGILECSEKTLRNRFLPELRKQRALRRLAIHSWQQAAAKKGNTTMLIWLGRQPEDRGGLGQQDQVTLGGDLDISRYSKEELQAIVTGKAKPLRKDEDGGKAG